MEFLYRAKEHYLVSKKEGSGWELRRCVSQDCLTVWRHRGGNIIFVDNSESVWHGWISSELVIIMGNIHTCGPNECIVISGQYCHVSMCHVTAVSGVLSLLISTSNIRATVAVYFPVNDSSRCRLLDDWLTGCYWVLSEHCKAHNSS